MAVREKSIFLPNEIYFITFTILGWQLIFTSNDYCQLIYRWFDYMNNEYGNKVYGYVIMPTHVHILLHISDKSPIISKLMQNAKRFLAYDIVKLLKKENKEELLKFFSDNKYKNTQANYKIFEERYNSLIIQSEKFFLEKLNYIHNNPLAEKWKLAKNVEDYTYSSASNYFNNNGLYNIKVMEF
jgi:putative transposase